jgi:hypothetical protein
MLRLPSALLGALLLAGCASGGGPGIDLYRGTWGEDGVRPPPNLKQAESSDLVGRTVTVADGPVLPIKAVLEDASGRQRYVLVSDPGSQEVVVVVPKSALTIAGDTVALNGSTKDLAWLQHHDVGQVERLYPKASAAKTEPPLAGAPIPLPVAEIPMVQPVPESLVILHSSSVVGMPVIDASGGSVGQVDSVAAVPGTGQVLYALVTGPQIGADTYILLPSSTMELREGKVTLPEMMAADLVALRHYKHGESLDMTGAVFLEQ